jgi:hypothetical protein
MTQVQFGNIGGIVLALVVIIVSALLFVYAERYARYSRHRAERMYGTLMSRQFTAVNVRLAAGGGVLLGTLVVVVCVLRAVDN